MDVRLRPCMRPAQLPALGELIKTNDVFSQRVIVVSVGIPCSRYLPYSLSNLPVQADVRSHAVQSELAEASASIRAPSRLGTIVP